jgi:hypothetical protein
VDTWTDRLETLPVEVQVKARLVYELASDRVPGEPVEVTSSALRAVAEAEGLDSSHPWIDAAARAIAQEPKPVPTDVGRRTGTGARP